MSLKSHVWVNVLVAALAISAGCERGAAVESEGAPPAEKAPEKAPQKAAEAKAVLVEQVPLLGAKIKGSDQALVTIVEVSDYQCPYCRKAHATIEQLLGEYQGVARLAVLENPLPFHKLAVPAAKWAFAAGEQGRYWQMRDALFENQKMLDEQGLTTLAENLGLDLDRMRSDSRSVAAERFVAGGLESASSLGVKGTPTFFINGVRVIGAQSPEVLRSAILDAKRRAEEMVARGIRPQEVYAEILRTAAPPKVAKAAAEKAEKGQGRGCDEGCGDTGDEAPAGPAEVFDVSVGNAPVRGLPNAPVTVVVFTDFECPFCKKGEETIRALEAEYGQKVRVAYKSYPLPFHDHARLAAKAALAAHRQGKFFEYKEKLFKGQEGLDRAKLIEYARELGLDLPRFEKDMADPAIEAAIAADEAEVERLSVKGTPTFFVNGRKVVGAQPFAMFRTQIDAALQRK